MPKGDGTGPGWGMGGFGWGRGRCGTGFRRGFCAGGRFGFARLQGAEGNSAELKAYADSLAHELESVRKRIAELEKG